MNSLNIKKLTLGSMGANCYIIENGDHSIIVDPGANGGYLIEYAHRLKIKFKYILITHAHFDHIGAVDMLVNEFESEVYLHENDFDVFYDDRLNLSSYYTPLKLKSQIIKVKDKIQIDGFSITFKNLPGHTHGSCFIIFDDYNIVFTGDILFKGSIGRYDFPTSSINEMKESIRQMYCIDTNYMIYPGHGDNTTMFEEKQNNPFFKA